MAKKSVKKESGFFDEFIQSFSSTFLGNFFGKLFESLIETVTEAVDDLAHRIAKYFGSFALFLVGVVFMSLSVVFLLEEYKILSYGWSFFVIGCLLFLASLILKRSIDKECC